jgi:hypothetical protein
MWGSKASARRTLRSAGGLQESLGFITFRRMKLATSGEMKIAQ